MLKKSRRLKKPSTNQPSNNKTTRLFSKFRKIITSKPKRLSDKTAIKGGYLGDILVGTSGLYTVSTSQNFDSIASTISDVSENPFMELFFRLFNKRTFTALRTGAYSFTMYLSETPWIYILLVFACLLECLVRCKYFSTIKYWHQQKPTHLPMLIFAGYTLSAVYEPISHIPLLIAIGLQTSATYKKS